MVNNTDNTGTVIVEIVVPLKNLSNFRMALEMLLINCEINLILTWLVNDITCKANRATIFAITGTKGYVPLIS